MNSRQTDISSVSSPGTYRYKPTGDSIDVYPLDPVGGILCVWGPDVGMSYSGCKDTQAVWTDDEWQGHVPVWAFDDDHDSWEKISD